MPTFLHDFSCCARENIEDRRLEQHAQRVLTLASFARHWRQRKLHTEHAAANGCRRRLCSRDICCAHLEGPYYRMDKSDPGSTAASKTCTVKLSFMVMKFRSTPPTVSTTVGCVLTGRRFHHWSLSFIDPRSGGVKDLERKCVDCGRRQHTQAVPDHETSELPRTLWCLGDWTWQEGELEP